MTISRALRLTFAAAALASLALVLLPPSLGGRVALVSVNGSSMEPAYETGDLTLVWRAAAYEVGDTVVYPTEQGQVIHRIVTTTPTGQFVTMGDNRDVIDDWRPEAEQIRGRVAMHVPGLGGLLERLGPLGIACMTALLGAVAGTWTRRRLISPALGQAALAATATLLASAGGALVATRTLGTLLPLTTEIIWRSSLFVGCASALALVGTVVAAHLGRARIASFSTDLVFGARLLDVRSIESAGRVLGKVSAKRLRKAADRHGMPVLREVAPDRVRYAVVAERLVLVHDLAI